eukprot:307630_1
MLSHQYIFICIVVWMYPCNGQVDTLFEITEGQSTSPDPWTSVVPGSETGSSIATKSSSTNDKCPNTNTGSCLLIRAKGTTGTDVSYVTKNLNVQQYGSLNIEYDYFHNGQSGDGVRECHFEYTCGTYTSPGYDMRGESF